MKPNQIFHGDCLEAMAGMEENSVDSIVCDPPYGLEFMGMKWDRLGNVGEGKSKIPTPAKSGQSFGERIGRVSYNASQNVRCKKCKHWKFSGTPCKCVAPDFPNIRAAQAQAMQGWHFAWACEALRVAKPGAYLLAFGGTRTFHRLACAIEDAGWTLRDTLSWNYGSGFPKSHDVSKALDRTAGAEREVVRTQAQKGAKFKAAQREIDNGGFNDPERTSFDVTAPATPEAKQWNGFGTALKPAWEPVLLFQKPLEGTYAENVLKWGCGALNIDACRIGSGGFQGKGFGCDGAIVPTGKGRWPANFLLSHTIFCEKVGEKRVKSKTPGTPYSWHGKNNEGGKMHAHRDADGLETVEAWNCVPDCPVAMLDEQSGVLKSGGKPGASYSSEYEGFYNPGNMQVSEFYGSSGGASRFFYVAKASREERNAGLEAVHTLFEKREGIEETEYKMRRPPDSETAPMVNRNSHPTVKPIALMRYLCRLVTPPGGTVLDCFAGSGSTGCAAVLEGLQFVGIEKEKEYAEIAEARIEHWAAIA